VGVGFFNLTMSSGLKHRRRDAIQSLWFFPAVAVLLALVLGYILSQVAVSDSGALNLILFRGDVDAARQLLVVVSGTMITVTGLVFVLTVVALQIASAQFSPRLLRSFLQDPGTRLVLSVFVATFAYSLGGLFTVGHTTADGTPFVPRLAVTGTLVLALVSVGMLVYYIQHITNAIRIDTVMVGVRNATTKSMRRLHPKPARESAGETPEPSIPVDALTVPVHGSGYVEQIDVDALARIATASDLTIWFRPQVGHHLVTGSVLAWAWSDLGIAFDHPQTIAAVNDSVALTIERRLEHDVGFGIRQLVDIELRAVAPSINDPYTAVQAIQHLSIIMTELATLATDDIVVAEGGRVRVFVPVPDFTLLLVLVCSNVRRSATNRPRVLVALLRMLENVAASETTQARRAEVANQVAGVVAYAEYHIEPDDLPFVLDMAASANFAAQHGRVDHGDQTE
jgi:uncharacterized membrane protein